MKEEILTGGRVTAQVVRKGELVHRTPCANARLLGGGSSARWNGWPTASFPPSSRLTPLETGQQSAKPG